MRVIPKENIKVRVIPKGVDSDGAYEAYCCICGICSSEVQLVKVIYGEVHAYCLECLDKKVDPWIVDLANDIVEQEKIMNKAW